VSPMPARVDTETDALLRTPSLVGMSLSPVQMPQQQAPQGLQSLLVACARAYKQDPRRPCFSIGTDSEQEAAATPAERKVIWDSREPPTSSLVVGILYSFMTCATYAVAAPTVGEYMQDLGESSKLVTSLAMSLSPFVSAAFCYPVIEMLNRLPLKRVMVCSAATLCFGQVVYALGGVAGSIALPLVARCITGAVSGPQLMTTYVARSVGTDRRSEVMLKAGIPIAIGTAMGPLLAAVLNVIVKTADLDSRAFNNGTMPGWGMALVVGIYAICLGLLLEEPGDKPEELKEKTAKVSVSPVPWKKLCYCYVVGFTWPMNIGCWELHTVIRARQAWGWTAFEIGISEAAVLFTVVLITEMIPWKKLFEGKAGPNGEKVCNDKKGMAVFLAMSLCAYLPLFGYFPASDTQDNPSRYAEIAVYAVGSILLVNGNMIGRQFTWSLVTKLAPKGHKQLALGLNAAIYMCGRGVGALLSGAVVSPNEYASVLLGITALAGVVLAVGYCHGLDPAK